MLCKRAQETTPFLCMKEVIMNNYQIPDLFALGEIESKAVLKACSAAHQALGELKRRGTDNAESKYSARDITLAGGERKFGD